MVIDTKNCGEEIKGQLGWGEAYNFRKKKDWLGKILTELLAFEYRGEGGEEASQCEYLNMWEQQVQRP